MDYKSLDLEELNRIIIEYFYGKEDKGKDRSIKIICKKAGLIAFDKALKEEFEKQKRKI